VPGQIGWGEIALIVIAICLVILTLHWT